LGCWAGRLRGCPADPGAGRAQNKPLLAPGRQAALNEGHRVVVGLSRGQAYLPDLSVTGARRRRPRGRAPVKATWHLSSDFAVPLGVRKDPAGSVRSPRQRMISAAGLLASRSAVRGPCMLAPRWRPSASAAGATAEPAAPTAARNPDYWPPIEP